MNFSGMMFVVSNKGYILGVSRKNDSTRFGLPGGKRDTGEAPQQTAVRETVEETGIIVLDSVIVFSEDGHHTFYATNWHGEINTKEVGIVKWLTVNDLTHPGSAFPEYNTKAIAALQKAFPDLKLK